nr:MAG TPA: hypothetical protein [Caudoviricetes sp.]
MQFDNIITLPREPKGATSAAGLLLRRKLVPMVTYKIYKEYLTGFLHML